MCNFVPRVSLLPFPWSGRERGRAPSEGKKRDPGNEVASYDV